jgi:predicted nucleic acid-binding protein
LLNQIIDGSLKAHINIVNLTEFYYILHRYNPEAAEEKTRNLRAYGINVVPVDDNSTWRIAAQTKSNHPMSLADAYAVATAKVTNSKLVIGKDPEFEGIDIEIIRV